MSEDADLLTYGIPYLIRAVKKDSKSWEIIDLEQILEDTKWNQNQFIDFCILLGTDYNKNPVRFGMQTSLKWINKVKNIENILAEKNNFPKNIDLSPISNYKEVRKVFTDAYMEEDSKVLLKYSLTFLGDQRGAKT